jgi:hypothetical protein
MLPLEMGRTSLLRVLRNSLFRVARRHPVLVANHHFNISDEQRIVRCGTCNQSAVAHWPYLDFPSG